MGRTKRDQPKPGYFDADEFFKYYAYSPGANERKAYERKKQAKASISKHKKH
jgi:hypothetical protein